ncbi:MAG: hypothetical protein V3U65_09470 [Granulosicoccaceae bacterium]
MRAHQHPNARFEIIYSGGGGAQAFGRRIEQSDILIMPFIDTFQD